MKGKGRERSAKRKKVKRLNKWNGQDSGKANKQMRIEQGKEKKIINIRTDITERKYES